MVVTVKKTVKKLRGKYKKKETVKLTPKQRRNNHMTFDILNGLTLPAAAERYGMNSAQAVQKSFRLTVVNFFLPHQRLAIKEKEYCIKYLRGLWLDTKI